MCYSADDSTAYNIETLFLLILIVLVGDNNNECSVQDINCWSKMSCNAL